MMGINDKRPKEQIKVTKAYVGGFCGMVINTVVHPLDLVKVRMQIFPGSINAMSMAKRIIRCEGLSALYVGWTAGVLRQATYTTTRLGTYTWLYEEYRNEYYEVPSLPVKMALGTIAGIAGAFAGTPSEVILVRRLADGRRDPCYICSSPCPRYKGTLHAIYKITTTEGVRELWRGGLLTIGRSVLVSFTHISIDAKAREALVKRHWEGSMLNFFIAFTSTLVTACLTLPVDTVKSRYQHNRKGKLTGSNEVFKKIIQREGVLYFWHGFLPYSTRLFIHTSFMVFLLDEITDMVNAIRH